MKNRIILCITILMPYVINTAFAMEKDGATKAKNDREVRCLDLYCLTVYNIHETNVAYRAENSHRLIRAIVNDNLKSVINFFRTVSFVLADDCIIALFRAHEHERLEIEKFLAANTLVQSSLLTDNDIGIGLLLLLSIQYELPAAFDKILSFETSQLQLVPNFCFERALKYAVKKRRQAYVTKLLEHPHISRRICTTLASIAIRLLDKNDIDTFMTLFVNERVQKSILDYVWDDK